MKEYFKLMDLPYELDELEPYISKDTMNYHYNYHHQGYVKNLNIALNKDKNFSKKFKTLNNILLNYDLAKPEAQVAIKNNAGGNMNHYLFWNFMINHKNPCTKIENFELINKYIEKSFGMFEDFKNEFSDAAKKLFGSGWAWLVYSPKTKKLHVVTTSGHGNPITNNCYPILVIDVWEHAYYLDYKNNRGKFVDNFFNIINWKAVNTLLEKVITTDSDVN